MNEEIEAVVFDFDGVIVNSMPAHANTWIKALGDKNIKCTEEDIFVREGYSSARIIRELADREVSDEEIQEIADKRHTYLKQENIDLFDWSPEILRKLSDKVKIGIVTGSEMREVEHLLPEELREKVSVFVTEDDYDKGKPHPEPFLQAVEKLKTPKGKILVVENAPAGVESAKKAGLRVVGIPTYIEKEELKEADLVVSDHEELSDYLLSL